MCQKNCRFIVGIDPDVDKSGVAVLDTASRSFVLLKSMRFSELVDYIRELKYASAVIEDSDVSTGFHYSRTDIPAIIFAKGRSVGLCHATFRHLCELMDSCNVPYTRQKPLRKAWKGKDGKITHEELSMFVKGLPSRTNQDIRDACLLAWTEAGYPIRLSARKSK